MPSGITITWKNPSVAAASGLVAGSHLRGKRKLPQYRLSGTPGCTTRLKGQSQKPASIPGRSHIFRTLPARRRAIARQATTIAAVVDPLRTAIMSPGRQAISEALPQGWQRWSRQAVVEWREDARLNGHCDAAAASVCTIG